MYVQYQYKKQKNGMEWNINESNRIEFSKLQQNEISEYHKCMGGLKKEGPYEAKIRELETSTRSTES